MPSPLIISLSSTAAEHADVMDELVALVLEVTAHVEDGERIDWERVWDDLDVAELSDGRELIIEAETSPFQEALKRRVVAARRAG